METSNKNNEHKIYVPVIFPPCTDIYFISKNIDSKSFRDDVREKLIKVMGRDLISMYDTCGFNPLLLIIDAESPSKLDSLIDSTRERGIDIHPAFISFTASPKSIIKRFSIVIDQDNEKQEDLIDKIKENRTILDLLELITDNLQKIPDSEYSKEKEGLIKEEIENMKNKDAKALIDEINKSRGDVKESLEEEKVKDAQEYLDEKFIKYIPIEIPPVLGIIFLRFSIETSSDDIKSVIEGFKGDSNVIDIYKIIGDYDYIIKVHQESIPKLHSFCEKLYERNIQTIMKCVLRTWKDEGWKPKEPKFPAAPPLELPLPQDRILRILCDETNGNILKEKIDTQVRMMNALDSSGILTGMAFGAIKNAIREVKKKVIYRTSVKLECKDWLKAMIFITAARGRKMELKRDINTMLLCVEEETFARKYYHVTGIVDFVVLLDCRDIYVLKDKIGEFTKKCGDNIRDIRIYFELDKDQSHQPFKLTPRVLARIKSLIPNSENFKETGYETKINRNEEDFSTRYYYYDLGEKKQEEKINLLAQPDSVHDKYYSYYHPDEIPGLIPTSEIRQEVMVHAYVRFKFSISKERKFREELETILRKREHPFLKKYDTIQDHTVVECIIVTKGFESLFKFVHRLDRHCNLSEVNLIFHQEFFKPAIPEGLRCKPCRLPVGEPCDACEFYTSKRTMTTIRTRDFGINTMEKCKIAIVQIKTTETGPETWLSKAKDDKNFKEKIGRYIKDAIKKGANIIVFPELSIPKEFFEEYLFSVKQELEEDLNKGIIPEELKKNFETNGISLSEHITVVRKNSDNWEMTDEEKNYGYNIRKENKKMNVYDDYIKVLIEKESKAQKRSDKIFVVAGSHYKCYEEQRDSNPYNVSPIIFYEEGKIEGYEQQKNIQGDPERNIANAKGILRFSNTGFGDFAVLLCRDISNEKIINSLLNEIDILICPAWDETFGRENVNERTTFNYIDRFLRQASVFTTVANNGVYGGSGVYGPFARSSDDAEKLERKIMKKDVEKMKFYEIDITDLDENRGKGGDRDRRYLHMLNAKRRHLDKKDKDAK